MAIIASLALFGLSGTALAQTVSGSTTIDIDGSTGIVTVTCETDLDDDAQGYYYALVDCVVRDSNGNQIASGASEDQYGVQGYAQVVLTFNGTPGTTYTAIGTHGGVATLSDYAELPPPQHSYYEYDDEFNFESFAENPQTYIDDWNWIGPGPEILTRQNTLKPGSTTATGIRYYTPDELSNLIFSAQSLFPARCDADFAAVIGSSYTNINFFESLLATSFIQYPPGAPNIPAHGSADAATLINQPGRPIELFPNFYPTAAGFPAGFQEFILIHEGLHHYTGWLDFPSPGSLDFETQFFSSGYRNTTNTTNDFTVWLTSGCPPAS
ncbi:MAG: hypothetical protein WDN23_02960 [Edaphobacter sp.]